MTAKGCGWERGEYDALCGGGVGLEDDRRERPSRLILARTFERTPGYKWWTQANEAKP